jgi:biopolymer transport protein ExbD
MKFRRNTKLLVEPASVATGDIAFNLIVFFLVCASVAPDSGRKQNIPKSESKQEKEQQSENIEVSLTRTTVAINGNPLPEREFLPRLQSSLKNKSKPEDRIVIVKSSKDTSYAHWIKVTGLIEQAGGVITLQIEEERTVMTPE